MRENLAFVPIEFGLVTSHGHVALRAFVFDRRLGLWMIDGLTAHARLPVRIPCRIGHHCRAPGESDRDVLAGGRGKTVVTSEASIGCLKQLLLGLVIRFRGPAWFRRKQQDHRSGQRG